MVTERDLHSAFQSLSQPPSTSSSVSSAGVAPAPLSSMASLVNSTSVVPLVHSTSNVAMDVAVAARETAQLIYFDANFRLFKFIFLI